jgi:hypothetical protein
VCTLRSTRAGRGVEPGSSLALVRGLAQRRAKHVVVLLRLVE